MYQFLWRRECRPSLSVISAAFMALGRSWVGVGDSTAGVGQGAAWNPFHLTCDPPPAPVQTSSPGRLAA